MPRRLLRIRRRISVSQSVERGDMTVEAWIAAEQILRLGSMVEEELDLHPDLLDELDRRLRDYVADLGDEVAKARARHALHAFVAAADAALNERIEA